MLSQALIENSTLTWLGLGGNDIGDVGAKSIAVLLNGVVSAPVLATDGAEIPNRR